jgi:hypothetical protein
MKTFLVERIVSSTWRLKRILQTEKKYSKCYSLDEKKRKVITRMVDYRYEGWQNAMLYETTLERQIYKASKELERLQTLRLSQGDCI